VRACGTKGAKVLPWFSPVPPPAVLWLCCLWCLSAPLFSASLEDLIGAERAVALQAGEKPALAQFKDAAPQFLPRHGALGELVEKTRRDLEPTVMVETLQVYQKPAAASAGALSAEEEAALYNGVVALSTLTGLQYYSASRGTLRTFYESSTVIDGPSSKKPLADPVYERPPAELTLYARQKDLTFGDNIYRYTFYHAPGALIFTQENLTSLTAGIIPAVGKNRLRSTVAILDAGDCLLVYALSMAKAASLPGMKERIGNSFTSRAEAIVRWFSAQAAAAFSKAHP
jgi:hypothetical protein